VATPVSLVDVLPTIADLTGGQLPPATELAGRSLLTLCDGAGEDREVLGEYLAEASIAPVVMIRRGDLKFVHCPADPDQLYDVAADPHETRDLAGDRDWSATVAELRAQVAERWDLAALDRDVRADQARRSYLDRALRVGRHTAWEHTPLRDGAGEYMRNHLDLNAVERDARWPPHPTHGDVR
jgi:choline-sulfatase